MNFKQFISEENTLATQIAHQDITPPPAIEGLLSAPNDPMTFNVLSDMMEEIGYDELAEYLRTGKNYGQAEREVVSKLKRVDPKFFIDLDYVRTTNSTISMKNDRFQVYQIQRGGPNGAIYTERPFTSSDLVFTPGLVFIMATRKYRKGWMS